MAEKPIMRMELFLSQPSELATPDDAQVGQDLLDTLAAHEHECVGMAANMIGVRKRVIVFTDGLDAGRPKNRVMFNPELLSGMGEYEAEEGCLSLTGMRSTKRFKRIKVRYRDQQWRVKTEQFQGFTAQIIQHEIDHCNGIVI